jgi:hypothetical protein
MPIVLPMLESAVIRRPMPFYASYAAFYRAIYALQRGGIPRRIVSGTFANMKDEASRILAGFSAMGLIDEHGLPGDDLRKLVGAFGKPSWREVLAEIIPRVYPFLPGKLEDLTGQQLRDSFVTYVGHDAESMRNVETFFLCLAAEAGTPMSETFSRRAARGIGDAKRWVRLAATEPHDKKETESGTATTKDAEDRAHPSKTSRLADQIVKLTALLSEGDMTDHEKNAVITILSYLGRRMNVA